ncbi:hypothetical protein J3R30DRAFT_3713128 [Lentinula aciculospora]|uniref:Uncharacterized protein n=1 Tax=Lentinula aciculospora TaxID=153920 RepID=A0A9W8ZXW6_9AGAR|nr:hypothetical protein J3R30DRAFT_3713128 [Lentinula aciculospora]
MYALAFFNLFVALTLSVNAAPLARREVPSVANAAASTVDVDDGFIDVALKRDSILDPITSILGGLGGIPDPASSILDPITSILGGATSVVDPGTSDPATSVLDPITSIIAPITSIIGPILGGLASATAVAGSIPTGVVEA